LQNGGDRRVVIDTPIADMVETMLANDTPAEIIVLAVRTAEIERHAQRHAQRLERTSGAIRSAKWREKRKQNQAKAEANDAAIDADASVTPTRHAQRHGVTERCDLSSLSFSNGEEERRTSEKENKKEKVGGSARGTRLSSEAQLPTADRQFAVAAGLSDVQTDRIWAEFVDYWISVPGQRGTKLNWSATWRNRVRAVAPKIGAKNASPKPKSEWSTALDKLGEFARSGDEGSRGGSGEVVQVLLPPRRSTG
jgi:hypothetical protein